MKIWCFLCFGEEEEDNYCSKKNKGTIMREDNLWNGSEGKTEDMDDDEPEGLGLGFSLGRVGSEELQSLLGDVRSDVPEREGLGIGSGSTEIFQYYDQFLSSRGQVNLKLGLGEESSSAAAGLDRENCDHDSHNKRPKVHSFSLDWGSSFASGMCSHGNGYSFHGTDNNTNQSSFENGIHYLSPMYDGRGSDNLFDSCNGTDDEGVNYDTSRTDDTTVQMDLTDDLLHMVLSFLDHIDLCRAARVCQQWRAASAHEDFWRFLNFENRSISVQQFEDMCLRYPNATAVNIYGVPAVHSLVMKTVSSLRNLEVLTLGKGQLGETFFQALTDCHMLKSLTINEAALGSGGIQEIPIYHDRLRHLQIVKCRVLRVSVRCPQLETLSLKRSSMPHAVLNCPLLLDLDIASCHKLSDAAIRSAATLCPLLESLDMSNCSCVSDETLREIALTCGNLHVLDASYCPNISLESVRLPMLTVLKLHSCEGITSASMAAIAHSYMLEVLELDNCSLLTSVSLDLPRLQNIRLVHCRKFVDLNLRSITLSSITVSNCPSLQRINIISNLLQKLVLQKQESLTTLTLQCQCLQEVDLTECESLTDSICDVFSDGGGSPMLRSLLLDNCEVCDYIFLQFSSFMNVGNMLMFGSRTACDEGGTDVTYIRRKVEDNSTFTDETCGRSSMEVSPKFAALKSYAKLKGITNLGSIGKNREGVNRGFVVNKSLTAVRFLSTSLISLSLAGCRGITSLELTCPYLEQVSLDGCDHLETASFCPVGLRSLNLGICPKLNVLHIDAPQMVSLELKGCGVLSEACINCPLLTSLDASFCSQLKDDCLSATTVSCPLIESLILMSCPSVGSEGLSSLRSLPHLILLDLSYTFLIDLHPVFESCLQLKILKLQACKYLTDSSLKALYKEGALPALRELDLSYGTLCQTAIEELLACCTHLTHVSLNGCVNMHDLNWGSSADQISELPSIHGSSGLYFKDEQPNRFLQHLNCVGCPNIKKVFIPPMARCFHLSSLNLSLSAYLKEVDVACFNLCFLNLSNCCSLEILKLKCPRMSSLFLQSCNIDEETVEAAISQCNMLETLDVRFCPKISPLSMGRLRAACPNLKRIFSSLVPS
ncbi:unnamed protein product [Ilex paraguariensis]|uniref:F-box domain-containing protein n=1 Tax=Ilex paraguariensis TaxID=185542 RepID=A0ABC8TI43_9AQUA